MHNMLTVKEEDFFSFSDDGTNHLTKRIFVKLAPHISPTKL